MTERLRNKSLAALLASIAIVTAALTASVLARTPGRAEDSHLGTAGPAAATLSGNGASLAQRVLATADSDLGFHVRRPTDLPPGLQAVHATSVREEGTGAMMIDFTFGVWPAGGLIDFDQPLIHIYQRNGVPPKAMPAPEGTIRTADGGTWEHRILSFPQPGGGARSLHAIDRVFPDGVYVTMDIRVTGSPDEALAILLRAANSLE